MKRIMFFLLLFVITVNAFSQKIHEKVVRGRVIDISTDRPLNGAMIELRSTELKTYTDSTGQFYIHVFKKSGSLVCSSDGYNSRIFDYRGPHWSGPHEIGLKKIEADDRYSNSMAGDTSWMSYWNGYKNTLSFMPFELVIGSLGIQYERGINFEHTLGLHTSIYLFGWGYSVNNYTFVTNDFTGIKIATFYRYYFNSKKTLRHFIEGQLMAGYFNFHPLIYKDYQADYNYVWNYNLTIGKELDFWSYGAGLAIGWAIPMPRFSHKIFNLTLGSQFFPLLAPKRFTVQDGDYTTDYLRDDLWWYLGGPGSVLQIKVSYGGFF